MDAISTLNWVLLGVDFLLTAFTDPGFRTRPERLVEQVQQAQNCTIPEDSGEVTCSRD